MNDVTKFEEIQLESDCVHNAITRFCEDNVTLTFDPRNLISLKMNVMRCDFSQVIIAAQHRLG